MKTALPHADWMASTVASEMLARAVTWRKVAESCQSRINARQARAWMRACALNWRRAVAVWAR